jgi:hypothetical protein
MNRHFIIHLGSLKPNPVINYLLMKKEKFYPINNQEDEDGYTLYPHNAIIDENIKDRRDMSSPDHAENTGPGATILQLPGFIISPAAIQGK